ncbi:MAG TPA: metallophosphoesterase, partial [Acidimicrobiia bacterium]|nr:metallophosphoesterase [Acidimicrobiia bacterium]
PPPPLPPLPPVGPVATLVGAGDIASCSVNGDEATAKLLDGVIAADPAATVFTVGDNAYDNGTPSEFTNCYGPTWGRHRDRTRPATGNHEYGTTNASGHFGYFGTRAGEPAKGYYSYDVGAWHVVVLNSNCSKVGGCGAGSPQEKWLRADLAASAASCTVAYWHHPRFNSGSYGNDSSVAAFWKALHEFGAEVVLNGHSHLYERFAPQRPDGTADPAFGIRQFIVGMGGRSNYPFGTVQANSEVRNSDTNGVMKLTLRPDGYDFAFLPVAGRSFTDTGSGTCHGRP